MNNYTIVSKNLQDELNIFCKNLIFDLGMVNKKFIYASINGIIKSHSCHLTKIARTFHESISLKKTVERLSRNLKNFDEEETMHNNYLNFIKPNLEENRLFFIDDSDIAKPNVKSFEYLGDIVDGSKEHKITKGYGLTEIVSLIKNEPAIIQSKLWSTADTEFISKNKILTELLEQNITFFNNDKDTYIFDRGFDQSNLIKFLIEKEVKFIIRLKSNRKIIIKNKSYTIDEILNKYKGKIVFKTTSQKGEIKNKLTYIKVKLNGIKQELTMIIAYPENNTEPAYIITNRDVKNAHDAKRAARDYFSRWKIEEFFKFKKQQFKLEDIRVRTLNALQTMNTLINYAIAFISISKIKNIFITKQIIKLANPIKQTVYFNYYRLAEGIKILLNGIVYKIKDYIDNAIRNINYILKSKKEQLTLFNFDVF